MAQVAFITSADPFQTASEFVVLSKFDEATPHRTQVLRETHVDYIRANVALWLRWRSLSERESSHPIFLTSIAGRADRNSLELSLHRNLINRSIDVRSNLFVSVDVKYC